MSLFQLMKLDTCLCLCSNWSLFNKKDTSSLSKGNFSTTNGHLLLSGGGKMERRRGANDHYGIIYTGDRRSTSRSEMELKPHTEAASASKTFWQHWCIPKWWGDFSMEISSYESKVEKIVCWEGSSIRGKLPVVAQTHEQKLVYIRDVVKFRSEIFFLKSCLEFFLSSNGSPKLRARMLRYGAGV